MDDKSTQASSLHVVLLDGDGNVKESDGVPVEPESASPEDSHEEK